MSIPRVILDRLKVAPGEKARLKKRDPGWAQTPELKKLGKETVAQRAKELLEEYQKDLSDAQELLWASDTRSLLIVLQAMDTAGKDGVIKHVMSGVNPQGCQVFCFKRPSDEELDHNFLWRYTNCLPERGRIGIFNRSYYEEVLVVKVHPEILERQKLPPGPRGKEFWRGRYDDINALEKHLERNGTTVVKFFLHLSRDEQRRRLLARLDDPDKHWKFSEQDVVERGFWAEYMDAFEDCLTATSTEWAPWYVIPADSKPVARALVASVVASTIHGLDLSYPELSADRRRTLEEARRRLEEEK